MCDNWFGMQSMHHNMAIEHFLRFYLGGATMKGKSVCNIV